MTGHAQDLTRRYASALRRIGSLTNLRRLVGLPADRDITPRQWEVIDAQLATAAERLSARVKAAGRAYLPTAHEPASARRMNAMLGELELDLAETFGFFDACMDVLTQRHAPNLGPLLAGCDALARESLHKPHAALRIVEPPLVYCDRGFGASTLREGVRLRHGIPNPLPLVQIPYSRLVEKCTLTSILHEVGHEVLVRLGLVAVLPVAVRAALTHARAPRQVCDYFPLWTSEIGPDFWTFCDAGLASAAAIQDILALRPDDVLRVSGTDPHPPPYLRVLLVFEWCRQAWGRGPWDAWEARWRELYDPADATPSARLLLHAALPYLPVVARTFFTTRFRVLEGRRLPDLFALDALAPARLAPLVERREGDAFRALPAAAQLAVFRLASEQGLPDTRLDAEMTAWLVALGRPADALPTASLTTPRRRQPPPLVVQAQDRRGAGLH
ncbi:hypothetical protein TBR22_A06480 [Luteitalea sp. TBR-22]|uniref:hypothetical protein n=1 Tax=Luteitalea sp. TBR-22 TaxID=2802971 RepID=UPI001AF192B7|nr:hypothetical protein [Luteitalea sp. TBR-22]BCS31447.1 hypothetical protein TBR22_A06480 [Luteitalea sp. TBR-22]